MTAVCRATTPATNVVTTLAATVYGVQSGVRGDVMLAQPTVIFNALRAICRSYRMAVMTSGRARQ